MYTRTPVQTFRQRAEAELRVLSPADALKLTRDRLDQAACGNRPALVDDTLDRLDVLGVMLQPDYESPPDTKSEREKLIDQTRALSCPTRNLHWR